MPGRSRPPPERKGDGLTAGFRNTRCCGTQHARRSPQSTTRRTPGAFRRSQAPNRRCVLDPSPAFRPERRQYQATEILGRVDRLRTPELWRILAVASVDLYIPILTFVFGEAQLGGPCAVISTWRLRPEVYGLPPNPELVRERLVKEAIHELGHTLDLTHCDDYGCAMAPSHAVEWMDLKGTALCAPCRARLAERGRLTQ